MSYQNNWPFLIYMLKASHLFNNTFVNFELSCNTLWSMSQQVFKDNQRIVRYPPLLPLKLEEPDAIITYLVWWTLNQTIIYRWEASREKEQCKKPRNLLCKISTILVKSSSSKAAFEIEAKVLVSGAQGFPFVASSVNLHRLNIKHRKFFRSELIQSHKKNLESKPDHRTKPI